MLQSAHTRLHCLLPDLSDLLRDLAQRLHESTEGARDAACKARRHLRNLLEHLCHLVLIADAGHLC